MQALDRAIQIIGSQSALADALNIKSPSISEWRARQRVPVERCVQIERATNGAVSRHDLRPDIFGPPPAATSKVATKRREAA